MFWTNLSFSATYLQELLHFIWICYYLDMDWDWHSCFLWTGTIMGISVCCCSGGRLAITLVARYFHHSYLPFSSHSPFHSPFSITTFSHRTATRIKSLIKWKLTGAPKTFQDPIGHFGAPGGHFGFCRRWASAPFAARLVFLSVI